MKHIKKALSYSIAGSLGLAVMASLSGCGDQSQSVGPGGDFSAQEGQEQSFFLVIEQTGSNPDTFELAEKHPTSGPTRAILRQQDGTERFLSEEELKQLAEEEAKKVEQGTSRLTEDPASYGGGMSMGETLLAAAAGSLIGGMIANQLMGNKNFQRTQSQYGGGRPTTTMSQPAKTGSKSSPKSGFFGGNTTGTSSSSSSSSSYGG